MIINSLGQMEYSVNVGYKSFPSNVMPFQLGDSQFFFHVSLCRLFFCQFCYGFY